MTNQPLKHIALAFSGGGFRAASFSLGCLSYLEHCKKLEEVSFIASTSGGTIANLSYTHMLYEGATFEAFYAHLKKFLDGETALKTAFDILNSSKAWDDTPDKGRNLINAFAKAYNQDLFNGATWSKLFDTTGEKHVKQICANSTEFKNGISFRFQNANGVTSTGITGNYLLFLRETAPFETLRKLRLGDITAASSCFPMGFEPIMFPEDFTYHTSQITLSKSALFDILDTHDAANQAASLSPSVEKHGSGLEFQLTQQVEGLENSRNTTLNEKPTQSHKPFGLMDGGITDNQAIQSLMLADERRNGGNFGTFIVCDVASPFMDAYQLPKVSKNFLAQFSLTKWGILYFALTILIGLLGCYYKSPVLYTIAGIMASIPIFIGIWIFSKLSGKNANNSWVKMIKKYIGYFFTIPVGSFWQMLQARIDSTVIMVSDVFLKQIRRMWYDQLYTNNKYENRRMSVLVYELSTKHYPVTEARLNGKDRKVQQIKALVEQDGLKPSEAMQKIAQKASEMGTTLWFDEHNVKDKVMEALIATGQFTMCYNLIMYLIKLEVEAPALVTTELSNLKKQLLADWKEFLKKPEFLV